MGGGIDGADVAAGVCVIANMQGACQPDRPGRVGEKQRAKSISTQAPHRFDRFKTHNAVHLA